MSTAWPELPPGARSRRGAGLRRLLRGSRRHPVRRVGCGLLVAAVLVVAGLAVLDRAGDAVASLWREDPVAGDPFDPGTTAPRESSGSERIDAIVDRGRLIVAVEEAPSLLVRDGASERGWSGFDVALLDLVARDLGVDPARTSYKPLPGAAREQAVVRGDADLAIGGYEVRVGVGAWAGPYFRSEVQLLVPARSPAPDLGSVEGDVCVARGSTYAGALGALGDRVVTRASTGACAALLGRSVGAVAGEVGVLAELAAADPEGVRLVGDTIALTEYGIGLAPGDPVLRDRVQAVLRRAAEDGTWARLYAEHVGPVVPEPPALVG